MKAAILATFRELIDQHPRIAAFILGWYASPFLFHLMHR